MFGGDRWGVGVNPMTAGKYTLLRIKPNSATKQVITTEYQLIETNFCFRILIMLALLSLVFANG